MDILYPNSYGSSTVQSILRLIFYIHNTLHMTSVAAVSCLPIAMMQLSWSFRSIILMLALNATSTFAANPELTRVPEWGHNPTNLTLDVYIPTPLPASPPVILAVSPYALNTHHAC